MTHTLANDFVSLSIAPEFGARVTSLVDLTTGRNWLVEGPAVGDPSDEAIYDGDQARGWDECFPTVAPCAHAYWGDMRDHGQLWGRPWRQIGDTTYEYAGHGYSFSRELVLDERTITAHYAVTNTADTTFPWMWSQHCLLATQPGERLVLNGLSSPNADVPREIEGIEQGTMLKDYAPVMSLARVGVAGDNEAIWLEWSAQSADYCGIWLDFGGWPESRPVHQAALEPTTAPAHDLVAAGKSARLLAPGETCGWQVTIRLESKGEN